ncbi:hypothetical protein [Alistipes sp. ZOR0009]|uniref:hypothetical protein n=1 Tax=Alistipes sp. ZOR0009 TaxID=1339253 RepID=UPI0012E00A29|nr:hypothetical protein [Alistipes sp. ZOR0009]
MPNVTYTPTLCVILKVRMVNQLIKNNVSVYEERLLKSFPSDLAADLKAVISILPLNQNSIKLCDGNIPYIKDLINSESINILLNGENLLIPHRIYFDEPDVYFENQLNRKQKIILNCIYLRHHNGYIRESRLKDLNEANEYWSIPFTIQLLGEYVFEILEVLDKHINNDTLENYCKFIEENPKYWKKTESRMISYWNEYYRYVFPKLKKYKGFELVKRIKTYRYHTV